MNLLQTAKKIHLVGIGGIGMSAIARVLHGWGYQVSGSDRHRTELTAALQREGIAVFYEHHGDRVIGADLVVISSAIPKDNPELAEAQRQTIPLLKRDGFLQELTATKTTLAVAGTHGKTTTSAMLAWTLLEAGYDPSFIVGGILQNLNTNARAGKGEHFVIEADEYDRAFLGLSPNTAVVTTVEHDHPDCYPTYEEMRSAFVSFVERIVKGGTVLLCGDEPEAQRLALDADRTDLLVETYGLSKGCNWRATGTGLGNNAAFQILYNENLVGTCALQVPGVHNVLNALAAIAASHSAGVQPEESMGHLARFRGTRRRFEIKGQAGGVTIVDDYAHHPTEIRATLAAARLKYPRRTLWAVFQPHTYSRTAALLDEFANAFDEANHVVMTDIYAARETNRLGISSSDLLSRMDHPDALYARSFEEAETVLLNRVQPGDIVLTMGAGDGYRIGEGLLSRLAQGTRP